MPNLLQTPANWSDGSVSPPAVWNGTAYAVEAPVTLTYTGTVAAGDTITATIASTSSGDYDAGHHIAVLVNGVDALTWGSSQQSYPTGGTVSITLAAGDTVAIQAMVDGCGYAPQFTLTPPTTPPECNYNCDCDDASGNRTLKQLRDDLMRRLGFGAQVNNPPPGMAELLNSFLIEAQELLYRRYAVLRTERFYTWNMVAGTRYYDLAANRDTCTKRLDPRMITWAGVSQGCGNWTELRCGIDPLLYSNETATGRPIKYEVRQCIEVWPAPADDSYQLRIKGHFGLEAFADDNDPTTIDDRAVFLLALSNAKAHYGRPDAGNYVRELETLLQNLVAGSHQTRRYIPGRDGRNDCVYVQPKPTVPFP